MPHPGHGRSRFIEISGKGIGRRGGPHGHRPGGLPDERPAGVSRCFAISALEQMSERHVCFRQIYFGIERTEPQRPPQMLERNVMISEKKTDGAAQLPANREVWID